MSIENFINLDNTVEGSIVFSFQIQYIHHSERSRFFYINYNIQHFHNLSIIIRITASFSDWWNVLDFIIAFLTR